MLICVSSLHLWRLLSQMLLRVTAKRERSQKCLSTMIPSEALLSMKAMIEMRVVRQ